MPSKTTLPLNVKQALEKAINLLKKNHLTSSWLDAEVLLASVLKTDRSFIISHGERELSLSQKKQFNRYIKLRINHYPLAYIIGHKEFYSLDFIVTPVVLIPRPESELLVDLALDIYRKKPSSTIIDLGTGSGCLIIALQKNLSNNPNTFALDISASALALAKKNASRHNLKNINFLKTDLLTIFIQKQQYLSNSKHLIILANLPYVPLDIVKKEPSISREPKLALVGGIDGLDIYRQLSEQIYTLSELTKLPITLICEINPEQKKSFQKIWKEKVIFKTDLAKKTRVGIVEIKNRPVK